MSDIQQLYLNLLAAWGDTPLDEPAVKELLGELVKQARKETLQEVKNLLPYGATFTDRFYELRDKLTKEE